MSFFCLLWIPLFYVFRKFFANTGEDGIAWALPLGIAYTAAIFLFGDMVTPGGFGFSRWLSGFIDIVSLPVLLPLAACLLLIALKRLPHNVDIAGFILLWLTPPAALRSVMWSSPGIPVMLIIVPLLWTALGVGIPALISFAKLFSQWYITVFAALGIAALPIAAATSWWAFYGNLPLIGYLCLFASLIPLAVWIVNQIIKGKKRRTASLP